LAGQNVEKQKYVNIFDDMGVDWEAIVNARDTARETGFIESVLSKRGVVLDLCCGTGRHSIILQRKGWTMIGLDLSKNLLAIAKQNMTREGVDFPLILGDLRFFPFRQAFDAVISMFTSFGYLPSEDDDVKSFKEIKRILRKGGRFVLDVANRDHIIRVFHEREWADYEPFYMLEKRSLELGETSRLLSEWTIIRRGTGEVKMLQHNVRLYGFQRLKQMLKKAGLGVEQVYGSYDGKQFSSDNSRMILLARNTD
jgi:SAM-dependent methyltransferase